MSYYSAKVVVDQFDEETTDYPSFVRNLIHFLTINISTFVRTWVMDWKATLRHPLDSLAKLMASLFFAYLLVGLAIMLHIAGWLGLGRVVIWLSDNVYGTRSLPNWGQPDPLDEMADAVEDGIGEMDKPEAQLVDFNHKIAQSLLFFASVLYEGVEHMEAALDINMPSHYMRECRVIGFKQMGAVGNRAAVFLIANTRNNLKHIVVSFRGTSPLDLNQWLLDATINKIEAKEHFPGLIHEGFYAVLFEKGNRKTTLYDDILRHIAKVIKNSSRGATDSTYRLWVTGHSLGGAVASLFYANLMKSNIFEGITMCSAYTFGALRAGNFDFAKQYAVYETDHKNTPARMFRVYTETDVAPLAPAGYNDPISGDVSNCPNSILNYCHIGTPICLPDPRIAYPTELLSSLTHRWILVLSSIRSIGTGDRKLLYDTIGATLVFLARATGFSDHAPSCYYKNLAITPESKEKGAFVN